MRIFLFVLSLMLSACAVISDRTVNVTEMEIQEKLNERLALPFSILKIFDVSLSNSIVRFDEATGRLNTSLDTSLVSPFFKESLTGKLAISGKLRFDTTKYAVVLDEPKIEKAHFQGLEGQYSALIEALTKTIGEQMLNGMTLYEVKPEDLRIGSTQYIPKDMQITHKRLEIRLSPQP